MRRRISCPSAPVNPSPTGWMSPAAAAAAASTLFGSGFGNYGRDIAVHVRFDNKE